VWPRKYHITVITLLVQNIIAIFTFLQLVIHFSQVLDAHTLLLINEMCYIVFLKVIWNTELELM
jgi:hypothetical protein